jgi:membrane protein implicated in regulation of membrane protease activity
MFFRNKIHTTPCDSQPMTIIGEGIVSEEIPPYRQGRVKFRGTWWNARCITNTTVRPGTIVHIVKKENITLFVVPAPFE